MFAHPSQSTGSLNKAPSFCKISKSGRKGEICGQLAQGEDQDTIVETLQKAKQLILSNQVSLLCHADLDKTIDEQTGELERQSKLEALIKNKLSRYVFAMQTPAGPRIIKIAEPTSFGNRLVGVLGSSVARKEHHLHAKASTIGVAATDSRGFLEQRKNGCLVRSCQVQTSLESSATILTPFLTKELSRNQEEALKQLAYAFADMHARKFFHADVKGFHAIVYPNKNALQNEPAYRLQWIDLARVSFHLTRRKRIINLYQALRFLVPNEPEAQQIFMGAYCKYSGWYADNPKRALLVVCKFLHYKLRTHPMA